MTVVEVVDRILSAEDEEISALAHKSFEKAGIRIMTSAKVTSVKKAKDSLAATIELADATAWCIIVPFLNLVKAAQQRAVDLALRIMAGLWSTRSSLESVRAAHRGKVVPSVLSGADPLSRRRATRDV